MLKLQFLTGKKHNEEWSTVKNCNFSKLQFFKCTFTVISLHIFAVWGKDSTTSATTGGREETNPAICTSPKLEDGKRAGKLYLSNND